MPKLPPLRKYEDNVKFMEDLKKGIPPLELREIDLSTGAPRARPVVTNLHSNLGPGRVADPLIPCAPLALSRTSCSATCGPRRTRPRRRSGRKPCPRRHRRRQSCSRSVAQGRRSEARPPPPRWRERASQGACMTCRYRSVRRRGACSGGPDGASQEGSAPVRRRPAPGSRSQAARSSLRGSAPVSMTPAVARGSRAAEPDPRSLRRRRRRRPRPQLRWAGSARRPRPHSRVAARQWWVPLRRHHRGCLAGRASLAGCGPGRAAARRVTAA